MRLFKLELKRVLKTRLTLILLALSLVLSLVMAYIPITFSYVTCLDDNGNDVKLVGLDALHYLKTLQANTSGEVSPGKIRQAVENYQVCFIKYGAKAIYDLPDGVYETDILLYSPLLHGVKEAFADPDSGIGASLTDIAPEKIDDFYNACETRLASLMRMEQESHPAAQEAAKALCLFPWRCCAVCCRFLFIWQRPLKLACGFIQFSPQAAWPCKPVFCVPLWILHSGALGTLRFGHPM